MSKQYQQQTTCLHGGYRPENGEPRNFPIVQSTTFRYDSCKEMGKLFDLEAAGYFYTRLANPTTDKTAMKLCELEGGTACMLTASGQAATFYALFNIVSCGDHVISTSSIYGGTYNLFAVTMKRMGIDFTFVDADIAPQDLAKEFRTNTKAVFGETLANPSLNVLDIEKFAKVAHEHGVPLIVDNTFPTPYGCQPIKWGADIVTHSTTKYLDGHATAVGGAIVDSGNFTWTEEKFPDLCTPDPSYHGVVFTERFGQEGAYITKAVVQLMRDLGATPAPMNSYLLNLGMETLTLRMKQHSSNALALAEFLHKHEKVAWVKYPYLSGDSQEEKAKKYLPNGASGVLSFGLVGGREAAEKLMSACEIASIATHVADAKTCMLHPASTTHRQLTAHELRDAGVPEEMLRLSVGIEALEDLLADFSKALDTL